MLGAAAVPAPVALTPARPAAACIPRLFAALKELVAPRNRLTSLDGVAAAPALRCVRRRVPACALAPTCPRSVIDVSFNFLESLEPLRDCLQLREVKANSNWSVAAAAWWPRGGRAHCLGWGGGRIASPLGVEGLPELTSLELGDNSIDECVPPAWGARERGVDASAVASIMQLRPLSLSTSLAFLDVTGNPIAASKHRTLRSRILDLVRGPRLRARAAPAPPRRPPWRRCRRWRF